MSDAENRGGSNQFFSSNGPETFGVSARQAEDEQAILELGPGQVEHGGSEEHGFVVGMGDEQTDASTAESREGLGHVCGEEPESEDDQGDLGGEEPVHGGG